jgi:predicted small secreted protein
MKKILVLSIALATMLLTGCNTVSGFGRDVQKVGQVVSGAGGK